MHDDAIARGYRREAMAEGDRSQRAPCPDLDVIERFLIGGLDDPARDALADHVATCRSCAELVQELGRLDDWAKRAAAARPGHERSGRAWLPRAVLALAAVLVLALGSLLFIERGGEAPTDAGVVRAANGRVTPAPGAVLAGVPTSFDWPDEAGATGYRLRLYSPRADLLWESGPRADSDCPLPAEVAAHLAAGSRYAWSVEVEGAVQRRELGPFGFEIAPE